MNLWCLKQNHFHKVIATLDFFVSNAATSCDQSFGLDVAKSLAYEEKLQNSFISFFISQVMWAAFIPDWLSHELWWDEEAKGVSAFFKVCLKSTLSGFYSVSSSSLSFCVWVLWDLWPWCLLLVWFRRRCQYNKCRVGSTQVLPNAWKAKFLEHREPVLWFQFVLESHFVSCFP